MATPAVPNGSTAFDINLYTGTGATQTITNAQGFQPSFIWFKSRSNTTDHVVHDVLRGTAGIARLFPDLTNAESATGDGFLSINSNGFTLDSTGTGGDVNTSGRTYVAWQWAGPSTGTSNTSGSITSSVAANTTAGFSVVTYTGTGANATVGHGLGSVPKMIFVKRRDSGAGSTNWLVYHALLNSGVTPAQFNIKLNLTSGQSGLTAIWNDTAPTSTVFTVGTNAETNGSGGSFVAYCWAEIPGYSKFGNFIGNGNTSGPFVYTGFRPKFIMVKRIDTTGDWQIIDTPRQPYNTATNNQLRPNSTATEATSGSYYIDILSNGFVDRTGASSNWNTSGGNYIFAAFAEVPFKYALAR